MIKILNKRNIVFTLIVISLVVLIIVVIKNQIPTPAVVSTSPIDKSVEISRDTQLSINFNQDIDPRAKKLVSISISPETEFDSTWLSNTYKIIPKKSLANDVVYTIKIVYQKKEIDTFSFTTAIFSPKEIQSFGSIQTQNDLDYGNALTNIVRDYPFYSSLPIKTQDYVVYYDFEQKKFAITFLNKDLSQDQKDLFTKKALNDIKKIGGPDNAPYYTQI